MREDDGVDTVALTNALGRVGVMRTAEGRAALIEAVGKQLGAALIVADLSLPTAHIFAILNACADRAGGMNALIRALTMLAGDDAEAVRFCGLLGPAETLVGTADENRLREPLERCAIPEIPRLFNVAVEGMVRPPAALHNAWDAFVRLADTNVRADGVPPHLVFVDLLATLLRSGDDPSFQAQAGVLRAWATEQIGTYRAKKNPIAERMERLRARFAGSAGPGFPMSLIILLEQDLRGAPGRYVVTHWRQTDPVRWSPEPAGDERVVELQEIPGAIAALLRGAERDWAGRFGGPLNLELFLPSELMNLDVDQWLGDAVDDPTAVPIGTEYEVVLRSQQRLRESGWHRSWNMRSQVLHAHRAPSELLRNSQKTVHRCPPEFDGDARKLRLHLNSRTEVVAYLLSSPPDREPGRSELIVAFRTGLPAVLWSRDPAVHDELWEAVENEPILGLPAAVKAMRTAAELGIDPAARIGRHISLVWDPYYRPIDLPPLSASM